SCSRNGRCRQRSRRDRRGRRPDGPRWPPFRGVVVDRDAAGRLSGQCSYGLASRRVSERAGRCPRTVGATAVSGGVHRVGHGRDASPMTRRDELGPRPSQGRTFSHRRNPGFADCAPSGRMRLDAIAGWLQAVAYAAVDDAGLARAAVWVVRRTRMRVHRFPWFGEHFELTTFCSGLGRMWAERRTDVVPCGEAEPAVEAVSLWVHLDGEYWRPM